MGAAARVLLLWLAAAFAVPGQANPHAFPPGASYTAAFTPGEALPVVLSTIKSAKSSILVAAYSFTSKPISMALLDAHKRGVKVAIVVDAADAAKGYSAARFLANHDVPVRANSRYAIHHNKFLVVDRSTLQTGSFNYTASASKRNAENVLVVRNVPALAASYAVEWQRLWNEGAEVRPSY